MGHVFSERGIEPDPNKVRAISDMPVPTDKRAVMRFCGMANYLSHFCPHLSATFKPVFDLTKQDQNFNWPDVQEESFRQAKQLISYSSCLAYFDINKPITLQVDASQNGLGAALLQPSDSGHIQPVAYTSCKLRSNEELWAQIEKECLVIVAACDKWDQWIYGREIHVQSDHQPLETIKTPLLAAPPPPPTPRSPKTDDAPPTLPHQSHI